MLASSIAANARFGKSRAGGWIVRPGGDVFSFGGWEKVGDFPARGTTGRCGKVARGGRFGGGRGWESVGACGKGAF